MSSPPRHVRRLLGLAFLAVAILQLILGRTLLVDQLRGTAFALYWLTCLIVVALALLTALLDALIIRQQLRRQQLELLRTLAHQPHPKSNPQNPTPQKVDSPKPT